MLNRLGSPFRARLWLFVGLSVPSLVLADCGASHHDAALRHPLPRATPKVAFWSPAVTKGEDVPAHYECARKIWLPLRWGALPKGTGELAIYFASYGTPLNSSREVTLREMVAAWLVVGLRPTTHGLLVGRIPAGAVGLPDTKLPVCPPARKDQRVDVMLFALPSAHKLDPASLGGTSSPDLIRSIRREATVWGEFNAAYD